MGRPLRVLYFVSNYHRFTGSQRSLHLLVRGFDAADVRPLVIFPGEGACTEAYRRAGIEVRVELPDESLNEFGGGLKRASWLKRAWLGAAKVLPYSLRLAKIMRAQRPDIVHLNNARSALLAGPAALACGIPRVYHVRSDERSLGFFSHASSAMASRIILVADGIWSSVPKRFHHKCRTVHNGIVPPTGAASRSRTELLGSVGFQELGPQEVLFVVVGSLTPFKGAHHALSALTALRRESPTIGSRIKLVFVGDFTEEPYGSHLRHLADENPGQVAFAGWDDQPLDWIRASDAVVLPTVEEEWLSLGDRRLHVFGTEGFSRTVLEAMSCARPVIATRVAGVPEQVADGETGVLVAPSNPAELAAAYATLVELGPQREAWGLAGQQHVGRFSIQQMCDKTLAVYRELSQQ